MPSGRWALGLLPLALGSCAAVPRTALPASIGAAPVLPPNPPSIPAVTAAAPLSFSFDGEARQGALLRGSVSGTHGVTVNRLSLDGADIPVAPDGRFLVAFGRDAPPTAMLRAYSTDGNSAAWTFSVAPRVWDIQSLPTLPKGTTPTPAFLARRKDELAQIAVARAIDSGSEGWRQRFIWPATGRISGVFGSQRIYAGEPGAPHAGVDVARPTGTPVMAPADGVVILSATSPFTLEGNLLMIDHGMGLNSAFLHLSRIDVHVGDVVRQGQPIGAVGMTGRATGPHLHWGMMWRKVRIDPAPLAGAMPQPQ